MKILLFKVREYITEENRFGYRTWKELPSHILLTCRYLRDLGYDVDLKVQDTYLDHDFAGYDVVAQWLSIADGLYEGLDYFRVAKKYGAKTAMLLFDDWEGLQKQILHDYSFVDYGVRGWDSEVNLGQLLAFLDGKNDVIPLTGIVYRTPETGKIFDGGRVIHHSDSLSHLKSSRELIEELGIENYDSHTVRLSSGCPFKCTFCHIRTQNNRYRVTDDFLDELSAFPNGSTLKFMTADIMADADWVRRFCNDVIAKGIRVEWSADCRFNWLKDTELLALMRKAGCYKLDFGVESFHPKMMKKYRKGYTTEVVDAGIQSLLNAGIIPSINMMIGHPEDDAETLASTCDFIASMGKRNVEMVGIQYLRPLPGTPIHNEAVEKGLIPEEYSYKEFTVARHSPMLPTCHLSMEQLISWKSKMDHAYYNGM
ncbi:hypothetical protein MTBPR1_20090 [Candidatus Terasakiella magnetica]|uniref:Radical SAM core domain-containing protein n=1 Tax=Candidatus Terasakiella magnetica TaxID=1867952 RepID=A0A1C3RGB7_9PROT|nr:radical SAM protein [Candidatus Terasakiella magnetica]SCA56242.1 hypothetical protein MTBPR1_20090 [Candidatus Terasakiella magnetica]